MNTPQFKKKAVAQSIGSSSGVADLGLAAASFLPERVRLVDGHMRAQAALSLTGEFQVVLPDSSRITMRRQDDGSVSGVDGDGKTIQLHL